MHIAAINTAKTHANCDRRAATAAPAPEAIAAAQAATDTPCCMHFVYAGGSTCVFAYIDNKEETEITTQNLLRQQETRLRNIYIYICAYL